MNATLQKLVVVSIESKIWGGRKKLRPGDIDKKSGDLPPRDLVSLGSRKVYDPDELKVFNAFKREIESLLGETGIKFAKNFALAVDEFVSRQSAVDAVIRRFDSKVAEFVVDYPAGLQRWRDKHPGHERLIEDAPTQHEVRSRFFLGYRPFAIGGADLPGSDGTPFDNTEQLVSGLAGRLYVEVATTARSMIARLHGRHDVTSRFLNPVRDMQAKLSSLVFLDPGITPMLDEIRKVLASLPNEKKLTGNHVHAVRGLLSILADPKGLRTHAAALGSSAALLLDEDDESDDGADDLLVFSAPPPASFDIRALSAVTLPEAGPADETVLVDEDMFSVEI
jgi:hypothetical protein